jgi:zinc transport system permease protein
MIVIFVISALISLIFAPIGCLVLWKRYVYFGDGLAHASMLAAVLSVISGVPILYAGIINTLLFALIVFKLRGKSGNNAAIGFASSVMLSIALILSYIFPNRFNVDRLLFGDIIAANISDLYTLFMILLCVVIFLAITYRDLLLIILSRDVAYSRGIKVQLLEFIFLAILSFAVLVTVKIVGALLVTSIILIPAMIARLISHSPLKMIISAILIAQLMNFIGVILSFYADLPLTPIIILCGGLIYAGLFVVINVRKSI